MLIKKNKKTNDKKKNLVVKKKPSDEKKNIVIERNEVVARTEEHNVEDDVNDFTENIMDEN